MNTRQRIWNRGLTIASVLALLLGSMPLHADRILVIGDSWAKPVGRQLQVILTENGHTDFIVQITPIVYSARGLSSPEKIDRIADWLDAWPDTTIVHLSIGGNDWNDWTSDMADTQEEAELFAEIMDDVETIVDYIFSIRPDVRIAWSSYDFGRPDDRMGTPTELNSAQIRRDELAVQLAVTKPGLSYVNIMSTLQVKFGFNGIQYTEYDPPYVIPPGDPSLPDPTLPSPYAAFNNPDAPLHPNTTGYKALAQAQYDLFYASALAGQDFQINPGLNDAWFNLATDGQGFLITVFPVRKEVFLAWFTFDTERPPDDVTAFLGEPGHRWLTAQGPYDGDTANLTIFLTEGGVFDAAKPTTTTDLGGYGAMTLEFADCTEGLVNYEINSLGLSGEIPIQRIGPDNVPLCESLNEQLQQLQD
jgi:hypothetical protein